MHPHRPWLDTATGQDPPLPRHGGTGPGAQEAAVDALPVSTRPGLQAAHLTHYRILVVDDHPDAAAMLATLLRLMGHQTHTAHDGSEAVAAADAFRPDVVLLDIGLPKLNGHEVARRLREQPWGRRLILVAVTAWAQEADRLESRRSGFDAHLLKPVDLSTLNALLAGLAAPRGSG